MKRVKPEQWLQWQRDDWGGAELPIAPPAKVKTGAANKLTKIAVQQWQDRPYTGLWGLVAAAGSLAQQWAVERRVADRKAWREHFAAKQPKQYVEWPKGKDKRDHTHWKWMEWRAKEHQWRWDMEVQEAARQNAWELRLTEEAADTHPWAQRADIRAAWQAADGDWRATSVWRSIVYACWRDTRPGVAAWPVWMQPQTGGKKGKPRDLPRVEACRDYAHPQGRNQRLRQTFEALPTRGEQEKAVEVMTVTTGGVPEWMTPRVTDPPRRPGRPRKEAGKVAGAIGERKDEETAERHAPQGIHVENNSP